MRTARPGVLLRFAAVFVLLVFGFALPQSLQARAFLEDPSQESSQSGVALIRGWACQANLIEIQIDNTPRLRAAYGTTREDTRSACGDANNGVGLTWNWNLSGDGVHRVRAFADGAQFADVTFTVTTLVVRFANNVRVRLPWRSQAAGRVGQPLAVSAELARAPQS